MERFSFDAIRGLFSPDTRQALEQALAAGWTAHDRSDPAEGEPRELTLDQALDIAERDADRLYFSPTRALRLVSATQYRRRRRS
ncbi:hypothetical protein [Nannocystis sp. SCPEA4]|uniref:hypothetical protein n=1 Tax=Nannocystis sp. SCPEA4 TaxID=2996787 RepID=UPI002271D2AE|nr:hypothetical protein [Nannocystis sp. SCPEA4]MCY1060225.1 hypothetical protein [Nannocystis sp. SCPEA4]